jgi:hypothetical protein
MNLSLYTTSGPINTEIWIIHDGAMFGKPKRASMDLCTDNGVVRATVVRSLSVCPYAIPRLEELKKINSQ